MRDRPPAINPDARHRTRHVVTTLNAVDVYSGRVACDKTVTDYTTGRRSFFFRSLATEICIRRYSHRVEYTWREKRTRDARTVGRYLDQGRTRGLGRTRLVSRVFVPLFLSRRPLVSRCDNL